MLEQPRGPMSARRSATSRRARNPETDPIGNAATEFVGPGPHDPRVARERERQPVQQGASFQGADAPHRRHALIRLLRPKRHQGMFLDFRPHHRCAEELGYDSSFWNYEPKASTRLLANTFHDYGKVYYSLYTKATVDFTPKVTDSCARQGHRRDDGRPRADCAAVVAATWRRVCAAATGARRVPCSGWCSRSCLGLGGWFIGLLIVLLVFPTMRRRRARRVHLDRAAIGLGENLGLGQRWAPGTRSAIGFAGSAAGALVALDRVPPPPGLWLSPPSRGCRGRREPDARSRSTSPESARSLRRLQPRRRPSR